MKRVAPAAERNKAPIVEVLRQELPSEGTVLEIASGSGQHVVYFARELPGLTWAPSDANADALESIRAHRDDAALQNVAPPVLLDATRDDWPLDHASAVLCINMIHIAPWAACLGLLRGAGRILPDGAPLVLYGPYSIDGDFTAESNIAFDRRLRSDDPEWGVRELREVERAAVQVGLGLSRVVPLPANNHVVVFRKQ